MDIEISGNDLILNNVNDFKLSHTFECGQCFRWNAAPMPDFDEAYAGVALGRALKIAQKDNTVVLFNTSLSDFKNIWSEYLDFSRDYGKIKSVLSENDEVLKKASEFGYGIHILNQDIWECIVSFIISANNNIPRIKKIINSLCENFGDKTEYDGETYYLFPDAQRIALLSLEDIAVIKSGFRDKYILDAAQKVASGEIDLSALKNMDKAAARKTLLSIKGVGEKVCNCILLFSLGMHDSFPVDVWIKRSVEKYYFSSADISVSEIEKFAAAKFGKLGGFAQQYIFFYTR